MLETIFIVDLRVENDTNLNRNVSELLAETDLSATPVWNLNQMPDDHDYLKSLLFYARVIHWTDSSGLFVRRKQRLFGNNI